MREKGTLVCWATVSRKTILANHPFVENVQKELGQLREEQEEDDSYRDAFGGTGQDGSSGDEL